MGLCSENNPADNGIEENVENSGLQKYREYIQQSTPEYDVKSLILPTYARKRILTLQRHDSFCVPAYKLCCDGV